MVLAEAMAAQLPIAASASGAIPEVVGRSGDLFAPGDWRAARRSRALRGPLAQPPGTRRAPDARGGWSVATRSAPTATRLAGRLRPRPGVTADVVVPTFEGRDMLARCLRALAAEPATVIVVDNGSADGTAELGAARLPRRRPRAPRGQRRVRARRERRRRGRARGGDRPRQQRRGRRAGVRRGDHRAAGRAAGRHGRRAHHDPRVRRDRRLRDRARPRPGRLQPRPARRPVGPPGHAQRRGGRVPAQRFRGRRRLRPGALRLRRGRRPGAAAGAPPGGRRRRPGRRAASTSAARRSASTRRGSASWRASGAALLLRRWGVLASRAAPRALLAEALVVGWGRCATARPCR